MKKNTIEFKSINNHNNDFDFLMKFHGIINLGNICYINAALQILLHCEVFIIKFYDNNDKYIKIYIQFLIKYLNLCYYIIKKKEKKIIILY